MKGRGGEAMIGGWSRRGRGQEGESSRLQFDCFVLIGWCVLT